MKKTVMITGCSSGFGFETAKYLTSKGYQVIACVRNKKHLSLHECSYLLDVEWDSDRLSEVVNKIVAEHGPIDCLINNAGFGLIGSITQLTQEQIYKQFSVNFFGVVELTKALLPHFISQKQGLIINVSSVLGIFSYPGYSMYSASKYALESFSSSLSVEYSSKGLKVVTINPGAFSTSFQNNAIAVDLEKEKPNGPSPLVFAKLVENILQSSNPQSRYIIGKEAFAVKVYLNSPEFIKSILLKLYLKITNG